MKHLVQDLTQIDLTTNHNPQCHVLATVIGHVLYAQMREPRAMFPQNGGWDDLTQIGYTVITGNTLYWMCKALCSGTSQRPVLGIQSGCHPTYPITLLRGTRANYSHRTSPSINLSVSVVLARDCAAAARSPVALISVLSMLSKLCGQHQLCGYIYGMPKTY